MYNDLEFADIFATFELADCTLDNIESTIEFLDDSLIDILEG